MCPPPSLVGATGRFAIRRLLGTGGFADVFEALDRQHQRRIALKLVRSPNRNSPERRLLEREFEALRSVEHPNLTKCHELFLENQDAFFTMELVEGTGFIDYVRADTPRRSRSSDFIGCGASGLLRLEKTLPQLVAGVEALHTAGLVHRDLHPGNVRVGFGGRVVVIDYGLAVGRGEANQVTEAQKPVGNTAYMAPEQHEHERELASDWYGVGVLLFEALTGALPFSGNDHEVFVRKRTLTAPNPSSLVAAIPAELDALCSELLARDPRDRPVGASILARLGVE